MNKTQRDIQEDIEKRFSMLFFFNCMSKDLHCKLLAADLIFGNNFISPVPTDHLPPEVQVSINLSKESVICNLSDISIQFFHIRSTCCFQFPALRKKNYKHIHGARERTLDYLKVVLEYFKYISLVKTATAVFFCFVFLFNFLS